MLVGWVAKGVGEAWIRGTLSLDLVLGSAGFVEKVTKKTDNGCNYCYSDQE